MGVKRLEVGLRGVCKMRVGKCRIKMPSVAMNTVAHRALEGGIGPGADTSLHIGRNIGAVDQSERRFERAATGIDGARRAGVADSAIAERGKLFAPCDGRG